MSAIIPYGSNGAWTLDNDIAELAAHYRLRFKTLKKSDARAGGLVAAARDALVWKLLEQRKFSVERVSQLLKLKDAKSVREARARHLHRVKEFNARFHPTDGEARDDAAATN